MKGKPRIRSIVGLDATRTLRAEIMAMAAAADREPGVFQVLWLERPKMTTERIEREWTAARRVLRPEVSRQLAVHAHTAGGRGRSFGEVPESLVEELGRVGQAHEGTAGTVPLPSPDFPFIILKLLVYAWLTNRGGVTARWLADAAGCSYPTVVSATKRIGRVVSRRRDRRLELEGFPRQEWARLLMVADEARSTMRFADRSGEPRSASSLAERLAEMRPPRVAVGGVLGARHHQPEIDLVGLPRLDVSVHCPGRSADVSFVRRLDPALEATSDPAEPARLVVHFVRHRQSLFEPSTHGLPWADPAECLMDLHEARLETPAAELVRALSARSQGLD